MLCDRCNQSQATIFGTSVIYHGDHPGDCTARQRNLCRECADIEEYEDPESKMADVLAAGCYYCGEQGVTICQPCAAELRRINQEKGYPPPQRGQTREDMARFAKIKMEVEDHMRKWVAEGGPDQP